LISASSSPQFRVEQALKAFCTDGDDESENGGSLARPPVFSRLSCLPRSATNDHQISGFLGMNLTVIFASLAFYETNP
jgi:hypothetical protein